MSKLSVSEIFAGPVMPVIVINDLAQAEPLARALKSGGITNLEVTLRTPVALEAIKLLSKKFPELCVGAGTIINVTDFDNAVKAGAKFIISPGASEKLLAHATKYKDEVEFIPGVATASEIITALEYGFDHVKFFPAEANGGAAALKAISAPLPQVSFCPTGGVSPKNVKDYLAVKAVKTVGGSWMIPADSLAAGDFEHIAELAKEAVTLINSLKA